MRQSIWLFVAVSVMALGCGSEAGAFDVDASLPEIDSGLASDVEVLESHDVSSFNEDLVAGEPTADVAFYITDAGPLEWDDLEPSILRAKRIFLVTGVQLRVSAALSISVPDDWQVLDPDDSDFPRTPEYLETDLYAHLDEIRMRPTDRNKAIMAAIISHFPEQPSGVPAANTIHVLTIDDAPISYYEWSGTEWTRSVSSTGGLSFPPYAYADRIPLGSRGIITVSTRTSPMFPQTRTLAHELGHKLINVSHEGVGVCPTFEANGDDLMLYGSGERIPEGEMGRWQRERLLISPFLYRLEQGAAQFEDTYQDGGVYRDRTYGTYMVDPPCIPPT